MSDIGDKIKAEVAAIENDAEPVVKRFYDQARVDIRETQPRLMAALGINTADEHGAIHATLDFVLQLLANYGPAEIRMLLVGGATIVKAVEAEKAAQ